MANVKLSAIAASGANPAATDNVVGVTAGAVDVLFTRAQVEAAIFGDVSGDGTATSTGALTVTKTGGTAFATSATTDTTNASNISSGTLPDARLSNTIVAGGPTGDGTHVAQITFDAHGRLTVVSSVAITASGTKTYSASTDPGAANDNTQGYAAGSIGVNTGTGRAFICRDASTGAAVWNLIKPGTHPGHVSNGGTQWYPTFVGAQAAPGGNPSNNAQYFMPFTVDTHITVSQLGIDITAAVAASNLQLALDTDAVDASNQHRPANLIDKTAATISGAATGFVSAVMGANQALEPGTTYWTCRNQDTAGVRTVGFSAATIISSLLGSTTGATATSVLPIVGISRAQAFGTMPASVGGSVWTEQTAVGGAAILALLIASVP